MIKEKSIFINLSFAVLMILALASAVYRVRPMSQNISLSYVEEKPVVITQAMPAVRLVSHLVAKPVEIVKSVAPQTVPAPLPIMPPSVVSRVLPVYPQMLLGQGIEGLTTIRALVSASGQVERAEVLASSGQVAFDSAALSAVSQWAFSPASHGNTSLQSWYEVPVRFAIN